MGLMFNLTDNAMEGQWKEFCDGVRVKIRPVTRSTYRKIRKEAETMVKRMKIDLDVEVDKKIYEHMIEDWEGILDHDGNSIDLSAFTLLAFPKILFIILKYFTLSTKMNFSGAHGKVRSFFLVLKKRFVKRFYLMNHYFQMKQ